MKSKLQGQCVLTNRQEKGIINRTRKMEGSSKLSGKMAIKKNKLYSVFQTTDCLEKIS